MTVQSAPDIVVIGAGVIGLSTGVCVAERGGGVEVSRSARALWSITNGIRIELRPQGTLVMSVHVGFIDTRNAVGFNGPKHDPADVASWVLDAVEAGREEVLADEQTRRTKAALPRDQELIYPDIEQQWQTARG